MKKNEEIKTLVMSFLLILAPILVGILLWDKLPAQIATHFTLHDSRPNGWSSKIMTIYGIPLMMTALQLFVVIFVKLDKSRKNIDPKILKVVYWLVPLVGFVVMLAIYGYSMGYQMNSSISASILLGVVFVVLGNYLPKVKQNNVMGIRVSWTLNSRENWRKTNRLAGFVFVICGIIFFVNTLLQQEWLLVVCLIVAVVVPLVYSYSLHRKGI